MDSWQLTSQQHLFCIRKQRQPFRYLCRICIRQTQFFRIRLVKLSPKRHRIGHFALRMICQESGQLLIVAAGENLRLFQAA